MPVKEVARPTLLRLKDLLGVSLEELKDLLGVSLEELKELVEAEGALLELVRRRREEIAKLEAELTVA